LINNRAHVVVEFREAGFFWAGNDTTEIYILWLIANVEGKVEASSGNNTTRCTSTTNCHALRIKKIDIEGKEVGPSLPGLSMNSRPLMGPSNFQMNSLCKTSDI